MTKYWIHYHLENTWKKFETWEDLIYFLYCGNTNYIGNNINDTYTLSEWSYKTESWIYTKHIRPMMVYDSNWRIINTEQLLYDINIIEQKIVFNHFYKPRKLPYFRYRYDPVPYKSNGRVAKNAGLHCKKFNKRYKSQLSEFVQFFPSDSRLRESCKKESAWYDYNIIVAQKSWKWQSKKQKQWM